MCFYPEPKDHIEPDRSLACKPAQGPSFATTCNQIRLRLIRLQGEQKVTWAGRTSLFFVNPPAAKKFLKRSRNNLTMPHQMCYNIIAKVGERFITLPPI